MLRMDVTGRIGSDPKRIEFGTETYCSISIAHNRKRRDADEETVWISCLLPYNKFSNVIQFLRVGMLILVSGYPAWRVYDSSITRRKEVGINLRVNTIELLSSRDEQQQQQQQEKKKKSDLPF